MGGYRIIHVCSFISSLDENKIAKYLVISLKLVVGINPYGGKKSKIHKLNDLIRLFFTNLSK
jgi:hypothetical protein